MLVDQQIEGAMQARRAEYAYTHTLQVFTCTWNVANYTPYAEQVYNDILRWMFAKDESNGSQTSTSVPAEAEGFTSAGTGAALSSSGALGDSDLIVIALQEVVNLDNPYNLTYLGDFTTGQYCTAWKDVFLTAINEFHRITGYGASPSGKQYQLLASTHLVGMAIFAYARVDDAEKNLAAAAAAAATLAARPGITAASFRDIRTFEYGCGFLGFGGNKGAVGLSVVVGDTPLAFVCSHLASGDGEKDYLKRSKDYSSIVLNAVFQRGSTRLNTDNSHLGLDSMYDNDDEDSTSEEQQQRAGSAGSEGDDGKAATEAAGAGSDSARTSATSTRQSGQSGSHVHLQQRKDYKRCGWRIARRAEHSTHRPLLSRHHETVFWLGDLNYRIKCSPFSELSLSTNAGIRVSMSDITTTTTATATATASATEDGSEEIGTAGMDELPVERMDAQGGDPRQKSLSNKEVLYLIDTNNLMPLLQRDELRYEMRRSQKKRRYDARGTSARRKHKFEACPYVTCDMEEGDTPIELDDVPLFEGFLEGEITFPPTYKYLKYDKAPVALALAEAKTTATALQKNKRNSDVEASATASTPSEVFSGLIERDTNDLFLHKEEYQRPKDYHAWYSRQYLGRSNLDKATEEPEDPIAPGHRSMRCPAWCDRIMWRDSYPRSQATNLEMRASTRITDYSRLPYIYGSDHKAVRATFTCNVRMIDKESEFKVYKQVRREVKTKLRDSANSSDLKVKTINILETPKPKTKQVRIQNTPPGIENPIVQSSPAANEGGGVLSSIWDSIVAILPASETDAEAVGPALAPEEYPHTPSAGGIWREVATPKPSYLEEYIEGANGIHITPKPV